MTALAGVGMLVGLLAFGSSTRNREVPMSQPPDSPVRFFPYGSEILDKPGIWVTSYVDEVDLDKMLSNGWEPYAAGAWLEQHPLNPEQVLPKRGFFLRCTEDLRVVRLPDGKFVVLPPGTDCVVRGPGVNDVALEGKEIGGPETHYQEFPVGSVETVEDIYQTKTSQVGDPKLPGLCLLGWEPYAGQVLMVPHPETGQGMVVKEVYLRKMVSRTFVTTPGGDRFMLAPNTRPVFQGSDDLLERLLGGDDSALGGEK